MALKLAIVRQNDLTHEIEVLITVPWDSDFVVEVVEHAFAGTPWYRLLRRFAKWLAPVVMKSVESRLKERSAQL
jgi:hypothetical protein